jgi:hypothetical protein
VRNLLQLVWIHSRTKSPWDFVSISSNNLFSRRAKECSIELSGYICDYCGTFFEIKPNFVALRFNDEISSDKLNIVWFMFLLFARHELDLEDFSSSSFNCTSFC